jgi:hypothetical protein
MASVYIVYHYMVIEDDGRYVVSEITDFVASSMTQAICHMEDNQYGDTHWWRIIQFGVDEKYDDEEDEDYEKRRIGWYDHKARKIPGSNFRKVVRKLKKRKHKEDWES